MGNSTQVLYVKVASPNLYPSIHPSLFRLIRQALNLKTSCFSIPNSSCTRPVLPGLAFLCLLQTTAPEFGLLRSSSDPPGLGMASPLVYKHSPHSPATNNQPERGRPDCSSLKATLRGRWAASLSFRSVAETPRRMEGLEPGLEYPPFDEDDGPVDCDCPVACYRGHRGYR